MRSMRPQKVSPSRPPGTSTRAASRNAASQPSQIRQCREPQPVARLVTDPAALAAQHGVLVPEHQEPGIRGQLAPGQHRQATQQTADKQADDPNDHSAMIPARQPAQARSGNRAPQEGRQRAKNLLRAAGKLAGHRSRSAPVHQGGGAGCGSSAGLVCEGPCTGGAASLTLAWRAMTASRVTLKTVRSWVTVTGPL